jgi:NAD(P)-dependent dehydrogenase (short-subunit alcohol dehydrogenase family)
LARGARRETLRVFEVTVRAMSLRVLITGASRGFGAALTRSFLERGALVFAGARQAAPGLAGSRAAGTGELVELELDVQSKSSLARAKAALLGRVDALDIVINNAAMRSSTVMEPLAGIDFEDVALTFDVNAIGPLRVAQAFLPLLEQGRAPMLVNISSEAGSIGQCWREGEFDYCMSKAALNMATRLLANQLRGRVRVLSLHPGWLRTDMGGAHAALDPLEAARESAALIQREATNLAGPLFLDHAGAVLPW